MDLIDRQLVQALVLNGRSSWAELGRAVGLSGPSVQERVRRLEDRGVITGYQAQVNPSMLDLGVSALVGLYQVDHVETEDVVQSLSQVGEVEDCWYVAGEENFVVKVRAPDVAELEAVVAKLRRVHGVARTRTTVVLSTRWEARPVPLRLEQVDGDRGADATGADGTGADGTAAGATGADGTAAGA